MKLKELLQQDEISKEVLEKLRTDDRSGVKKLLSSYDKIQEKKLFYKKSTKKNHFMKINVIIEDVNTSVV